VKLFAAIFTIITLGVPAAYAETLTPVEDFGDNPGNIRMYKYVPDDVPPDAPLVVSLHGCTQDAGIYSINGWLDVADEWKFYLVFPEQKVINNPYRCWNWFEAANTRRGRGEIRSIIEMIERMQADHSIDADRIYIEGLSAGGWLVPILLAAYPDVFAGGATNAGGPAYCAVTEKYFWDVFNWWYSYYALENAEECTDGTDNSPEDWGELARDNGYEDYDGPWPVISIWHGGDDDRVEEENQQELVDQWTNLHGIDLVADREEIKPPGSGIQHTEYHDGAGRVLVETWYLPDMAHGTPIDTTTGQYCGEESDYILDAGICAVRRITEFWRLNN